MTQGDVTEVVCSGKTGWVNKIHPMYLVSGCCGTVLADMPLQHCVEVKNSTSGLDNWGVDFHF